MVPTRRRFDLALSAKKPAVKDNRTEYADKVLRRKLESGQRNGGCVWPGRENPGAACQRQINVWLDADPPAPGHNLRRSPMSRAASRRRTRDSRRLRRSGKPHRDPGRPWRGAAVQGPSPSSTGPVGRSAIRGRAPGAIAGTLPDRRGTGQGAIRIRSPKWVDVGWRPQKPAPFLLQFPPPVKGHQQPSKCPKEAATPGQRPESRRCRLLLDSQVVRDGVRLFTSKAGRSTDTAKSNLHRRPRNPPVHRRAAVPQRRAKNLRSTIIGGDCDFRTSHESKIPKSSHNPSAPPLGTIWASITHIHLNR